ncbi:MAG: hypothetical protein JSS49_00935 [Planctomycetes bacterium]|nr:hypothetical protein [Planctomycetota bacterium]
MEAANESVHPGAARIRRALLTVVAVLGAAAVYVVYDQISVRITFSNDSSTPLWIKHSYVDANLQGGRAEMPAMVPPAVTLFNDVKLPPERQISTTYRTIHTKALHSSIGILQQVPDAKDSSNFILSEISNPRISTLVEWGYHITVDSNLRISREPSTLRHWFNSSLSWMPRKW